MGGVRGGRPGPAHPLGRRARRLPAGPGLPVDLRRRGLVVGGPAVLGAAAVAACSSATPACGTRSPRTAPGGCPTSSPAWTRSGRAPTTPASSATSSSSTSPASPATTSTRNCFFAASTPGADEIARRHAIGVGNMHVGQRPAPPRGHLPPHPQVDHRAVPRRARGRDGADPRDHRRRASTGSTSAALQRDRRPHRPDRTTASTPEPARPQSADRTHAEHVHTEGCT